MSELDLRTTLGTALIAFKGWTAPEVWDSLHPALPLAKSLERNDALVPILFGLRVSAMLRGRMAEALSWAKEALDTAKTTGDADLLITGHVSATICYFFMGRLIESLGHGDKVLALYDQEKYRHLVDPPMF